MSELPKGWVDARIGDLVELNPKQAFDDETVAGFVPMSHAPTNFRDKLRFDERPWGEIKKAYTNFKNGDVIFAKVTPCFENGKAAFVEGLPNGIGAGSSEFFVLRPYCDEVSSKYLLALVKSHDFLREGAENMTGAVGLRRVPKQFVENYPVPMPPAAEQARIAAKLDELLAQVDTLKARIDGIPALLKRFRQSVLAAAVSGRLTEEWRAQPLEEIDQDDLVQARRHALGSKVSDCIAALESFNGYQEVPKGWIGCNFDLLCEVRHGYAFESEFFSDSGPVVLTPGNFTEDGLLDFRNKRVVRLKGEFESKWVLDNGDILVVMTDLSPKKLILGKTVRLNSNEIVLHNQRIGKVIPFSKQVSRDFLRLALLAPRTKRVVDETATGTVVQHTSPKKILAIPTLLPPPSEQTEIVRRVEQLFAFADRMEAKVNAAKTRIDRLTQSILAKAFRGELVPQDPNDEPASVLLERIKAQRAAAPKPKRAKKASV